MEYSSQVIELLESVEHQLSAFWKPIKRHFLIGGEYEQQFQKSLNAARMSLRAANNIYFEKYDFSILNTVHYSIFLYFLAHEIGKNAWDSYNVELADKIYYLNKIMNSVDWYWGIELPKHFIAEHPVGTVLGRAKYGDYLCVYQGCTIGGSIKHGELQYPRLSDYLVLYANTSILGNCSIGKNVVVSANSFILNEDIPANTLVFGASPNLVLKPLDRDKRVELFGDIWKNYKIEEK